MNKDIKDRTGTIRRMNDGELFKCIAYRNNKDCDFELVDKEHNYKVCHKLYWNFEHGSMKSPYSKSVANVGYLGVGATHKTNPTAYRMWYNMIYRCYCTRMDRRRDINYEDCEVDEKWHCFQNFNDWYNNESSLYKCNEKVCIDKDLLIKNNKIYSEDTCVLLPEKINIFLTKTSHTRGKYPIGVYYDKYKNKFIAQCCNPFGDNKNEKRNLGSFNTSEEAFLAYKNTKEKYARMLADKYNGIIDTKAINALKNYKVEVND